MLSGFRINPCLDKSYYLKKFFSYLQGISIIPRILINTTVNNDRGWFHHASIINASSTIANAVPSLTMRGENRSTR